MRRALRLPAAGPALVGLAVAAAVCVVAVVDPNQPGHYPLCPVKALTGLSCPGCGSLRALHALAHGDLPGAFAHNPLAVAVLPLLVWTYLAWTVRVAVGTARHRISPAWMPRAVLVTVALFTVVRNLPTVTWLGR